MIFLAVLLALTSGCEQDWADRMGINPMVRLLFHPFEAYPLERLEEALRLDPPLLSFVVIGDTDVTAGDGSPGAAPPVYVEIMNVIRSMKPLPDFLFHVGDVATRPGDEAAWRWWKDAALPFSVTPGRGLGGDGGEGPLLYVLPGDQDVVDEATEAAFLRMFPRPGGKVYFSFDMGEVHFIALNSETVDENRWMRLLGWNRWRNRITGSQWSWLTADLERNRGKKIVLFIHKPFFPPSFSRYEGMCLDQYFFDRERLLDLLAAYRIEAVFAGHDPVFYWNRVRGIDYIVTGGGGRKPGAPRRLGGFHHFTYVTIRKGERVDIYCIDPHRRMVKDHLAVEATALVRGEGSSRVLGSAG